MNKKTNRLSKLKKLTFTDVSNRLKRHLFGRWTSIGFRRDMSIPYPAPAAKIPLRIRPLEDRDIDILFAMPEDASPEVIRDVLERREMKDAGIKTCFVAVTSDNVPCYMQWLIPAEFNPTIRSFFNRRFPELKPNEMLLEGAFVPPGFRGMGIMPAAMALIAEQAKTFGADAIITFVEHDNIPSLKGCKRAGFNPYLIRRDEFLLNRSFRRLRFIPAESYSLKPPIPLWLLPEPNVLPGNFKEEPGRNVAEDSTRGAIAH